MLRLAWLAATTVTAKIGRFKAHFSTNPRLFAVLSRSTVAGSGGGGGGGVVVVGGGDGGGGVVDKVKVKEEASSHTGGR